MLMLATSWCASVRILQVNPSRLSALAEHLLAEEQQCLEGLCMYCSHFLLGFFTWRKSGPPGQTSVYILISLSLVDALSLTFHRKIFIAPETFSPHPKILVPPTVSPYSFCSMVGPSASVPSSEAATGGGGKS